MTDVVIIGGGIVGLATAHALLADVPMLPVHPPLLYLLIAAAAKAVGWSMTVFRVMTSWPRPSTWGARMRWHAALGVMCSAMLVALLPAWAWHLWRNAPRGERAGRVAAFLVLALVLGSA